MTTRVENIHCEGKLPDAENKNERRADSSGHATELLMADCHGWLLSRPLL
jgi:hypothetical protein